jgi:branched-chain amino acid transport system permease protein
VALGYTMVYGVLQFINFAHSEIFMMGAFGGILLASWLGVITSPALLFIMVTLGCMIFCMGLALTVERIAYPP